MDRPPLLERLAAWSRGHPSAVDGALAGVLALFTVVLPATYGLGSGPTS